MEGEERSRIQILNSFCYDACRSPLHCLLGWVHQNQWLKVQVKKPLTFCHRFSSSMFFCQCLSAWILQWFVADIHSQWALFYLLKTEVSPSVHALYCVESTTECKQLLGVAACSRIEFCKVNLLMQYAVFTFICSLLDLKEVILWCRQTMYGTSVRPFQHVIPLPSILLPSSHCNDKVQQRQKESGADAVFTGTCEDASFPNTLVQYLSPDFWIPLLYYLFPNISLSCFL